VVAGEIDPTGAGKNALDAFLGSNLEEGFEIETHIREVTMIPAEPKRS
jgi:hypothetical protein